MESPLEASALSTYLSVRKAVKEVTQHEKGNQLGWVPYRAKELEDRSMPADWESACREQCKDLGLDFNETKGHLEWVTALAGSIERGQKGFCYGAVHRFLDHDVGHAQLVVTQPTKKAKLAKKAESRKKVIVSLTNFEVDALLPYCSPAPFGDLLTETTKLDPNFRRPLEANCDVKLDYKCERAEDSFYWGYGRREENLKYPQPIFEYYLKTAVKEHLSHGQEVNLVPYKLNIYGEGDFFKPHTDTPVNPRLFIGTVVVCLPSQFTGGELLVSHGDTCQTFDFAAKSGVPGLYQFATFYGDCLHEIKPVTQGRRVTITYHVLRREPGERQEIEDADVYYPYEDGKVSAFPLPSGNAVPEKLYAELTSELRALSEMGYPHVGFLLQHEYTMSGLGPEGLKGSDQSLFDLFSRLGWPCRFLPVLVVDDKHQEVGDDAMHEYDTFSRNVYAFTKQDFEFYTGALDAKPDHALKTAVPFMWYGEQAADRVLDHHVSAGGHQGNHSEPSEDQTVYLQSAMVVDLSCKV